MERSALVLGLALLAADSAAGREDARVPVETFELSNGMSLKVIP